MKLPHLALLLAACLLEGSTSGAAVPEPAPGHENAPVIFFAHFMPQVSWGDIHSNGHIGGNADVFPFYPQSGTKLEQMKRAMLAALDSGINGFQFLTVVPREAWKAAEEVRKETGKLFYIAPEWCDMGPDRKKAAERIAAFLKEHEKSPFIYRRNGVQVHFLYNHGKWAGENTNRSEGVREVKKMLADQGLKVLLVPTVGDLGKTVLDRPDRTHAPFDPFRKTEFGPLKYLKETNWDGATDLNSGSDMRDDQIREIKKRLAELGKPFLFVPALRSMYDSSNRYWQAIHCRGEGFRVLRRDLRQWIEHGFRIFTFSTWNDVNETMLMPSSRNVWGLNDMIRYYHGLAENGKSPFPSPRFLLSYEPEVLLGEQGFFQFLVIPETDTLSGDYRANVSLRDLNGKEISAFSLLAQIDGESRDSFNEYRFDTTFLNTPEMVLIPYVTVTQIDKSSGASRKLYNSVRLAPIRVRCNRLSYFVPYTISLNHINPSSSLKLSWENAPSPVLVSETGKLPNLKLDIRGDKEFRRVNFAESSLHIGAVRPSDAKGKALKYFIRFSVDTPVKAKFMVQNGTIDSAYTPFWDLNRAYRKIGSEKAELSLPVGYRSLPLVVEISGSPETEWTLAVPGAPVLKGTIRSLVEQPILKEMVSAGKKNVLSMQMTTDATDPNIDFPISKSAVARRPLPVQEGSDSMRVIHAWGLDRNEMLSYSNPVALKIKKYTGAKIPVRFLQTGGTFDDFVNNHNAASENKFTRSDIRSRTVDTSLIPYHLLTFDEGAGREVNHHGTAHQLGRGWLEGKYLWNRNGWRNSSLKLQGGVLKLRSKTMPHGCLTVSMRIRLDESAASRENAVMEDADNYQMKLSGSFSLTVEPDGRVTLHRPISGRDANLSSAVPLKKGWNHIVAVYDLESLKLYLNGVPAGEKKNLKPAYARTHSTPSIGTSRLKKGKQGEPLSFHGEIDQLEIIGTALNDADVRKLYQNGSWK